MTSLQYITFILREIGYDDNNGDFKWDEFLSKAKNIGLISTVEKEILSSKKAFLRDDMVAISYSSLMINLKDSDITLGIN